MQLVVMDAAFMMHLFLTGLFLAAHLSLYFTKDTPVFLKVLWVKACFFLDSFYKSKCKLLLGQEV